MVASWERKVGVLGTLTVLCAVVAVGVWVEGRTAGEDAGRTTAKQIQRQAWLSEREFYTTACERNNIVKAEARVAVRDVKAPRVTVRRRDKLFVIIDCESTFERGGHGVPLTGDQEQRYMDVVRQGRIPDLRHGEVIGSHEPGQGGLADF